MPAVKFGQDTCTVTLNLEKLCDLPLANIRKLYAMILSEPWRADNTDAAATMSAGKSSKQSGWMPRHNTAIKCNLILRSE